MPEFWVLPAFVLGDAGSCPLIFKGLKNCMKERFRVGLYRGFIGLGAYGVEEVQGFGFMWAS